MKRALCWIRRDLRLSDHAAHAAATQSADATAVVFVFDPLILNALVDRDDRRVTFIHDSLAEIDSALRRRGSRLIVGHGDPIQEIPRIARLLQIDQVYCNHDYDPYAIDRDVAVHSALLNQGQKLVTSKDQVVFELDEVLSGAGSPMKVYTPYRKAWEARLTYESDLAEFTPDLTKLLPSQELVGTPELPSLAEIGFQRGDLWLEAGEAAARARLQDFLTRLPDYGAQRDYPAVNGTSGLSVHLRHGTVSIRECFRFAHAHPSVGSTKWWNELIWREFYHQILANFPHVVRGAFRPEYDAVDWRGGDDLFEKWCRGETGYPIVDAAMRCLNTTGWMHNRLRMVTASFLTKDLLVSWQRGEAYFARMLLDFDLAQNNGGWQWAASTGCDAQPYFRIFNPVLQSRKFDPDGSFIREWCPELSHLSDEDIHAPWELGVFAPEAATYPLPIVDHHAQKALAIKILEEARSIAEPA